MHRSALLLLLFAATALSAPPPSLSVGQRIAARFDFEEQKLGNFDAIPMHWFRIQSPSFPHYTEISFDTSQSCSATHSLALRLNGGSAGIQLQPGAVVAMPDADYFVSAQIRTDKAVYTRALVEAFFVDQYLHVIPASRSRSPLTISNGQWSRVHLSLKGDFPDAAWIVLRLLMLQPEEYHSLDGPHEADRFHVHHQDIDATAWFDDVTIYQLPRIQLTSQSPFNMIRQPQSPQLNVLVRDLTGETFTTTVNVYDDSGNLVDRRVRSSHESVTADWSWQPDLPRLGWYWAELLVQAHNSLVGRRVIALGWMPPATPLSHQSQRAFGIIINDLPAQERDLLIPLLDEVGGRALTFPIWRSDMSSSDLTITTDAADPLITSLLDQGYAVTLNLAEVPRELAQAARTDVNTPLDLFTRDPALWAGYLDGILNLYAGRIQHWQVGRSGSSEAFLRRDLQPVYDNLLNHFQRFLAHPDLILSWSAEYQLDAAASSAAGLSIAIPASIEPMEIPDYAASWAGARGRVALDIQTLPTSLYLHRQRADDLALRMVYAWSTDPNQLTIDQPWSRTVNERPAFLPDPLLLVWSNVMSHLAGRRVVGEVTLAQGTQCLILEGDADRGGALVAWNQWANPKDAFIDMYLGEHPRATDIWGNSIPVPLVGENHNLPLQRSPIFVEGIDAKLARFKASFHISPPFVESSNKMHHHTLSLTNPWPTVVSGTLRLTRPEDWNINPRLLNFSIPAGQTIELPIDLNFPISETAGIKLITGIVDFDAERHYTVEFAAPLRIGLRDIVFSPTLSVEAGSDGTKDIVISAVISNDGNDTRSLYVYSYVKDQPSRQRIISELQPGQTTIKRFRYPGIADDLSGSTARVGLREMDGPALLNEVLDVP